MYYKKTCCPHCQTLYRISIDQLTIGHGRVLCGECKSIFNAIEHLYETPHQEVYVHGHKRALFEQDANAHTHPEIIRFFQQTTPQSSLSLLEYLNKLS